MKKINYQILLKPQTIFLGILIGIALGIFSKSISHHLAPIGQIYLNLIQMSVLPIMVTAVISGFGNLFYSDSAKIYVKRFGAVFLIGLIGAAIFGLIIGSLGNLGANIDDNTKLLLSHNVIQAQDVYETSNSDYSLLAFFKNIVPINIFSSLSQNDMLPVLFFCMLLGIALGQVHSQESNTAIMVLQGIYSALLKMVTWIMYGLPFGLCCLFSEYVSKLGMSELSALSYLILLFYLALFLMAFAYSLIIWLYKGGSYWSSIYALKEPLLIAFGTSSSLSAIPMMLKNLQHRFKLEKDVADFVVPLGISLNRQGTIVRFVITALFTAQLFNQSLTFTHLTLILITSILAGIAASGLPGIASVGVLAFVLQPLGLPASVGIALLTAIVPVTDPFVTLVNVYGNCASAIIIAKRKAAVAQQTYAISETDLDSGKEQS